MASTSLEEIAALRSPLITYAVREGHARMQPVALTTPLTVPTLTGQDAQESVVDFIDGLSTFRTVSGLSELDVLQRVVPAVLRGAAAQWLRFQPPFLSWDNFPTGQCTLAMEEHLQTKGRSVKWLQCFDYFK
ncbi:hypothetical protein MTO96_039646 [Rhipicephalus appendiculatus]